MGKKGEYIIDDSFIFDIIDEKLAKIDKNILRKACEMIDNSIKTRVIVQFQNLKEQFLEQ